MTRDDCAQTVTEIALAIYDSTIFAFRYHRHGMPAHVQDDLIASLQSHTLPSMATLEELVGRLCWELDYAATRRSLSDAETAAHRTAWRLSDAMFGRHINWCPRLAPGFYGKYADED